MKKQLIAFPIIFALSSIPFNIYADSTKKSYPAVTNAPQPTACIASAFTKSGQDGAWWNITLKLTNKCGSAVDLQNMSVTFNNADSVNTNFWVTSPLSYPDNQLVITSQPSGSGYLATLTTHFPEESWANSKLANNQTFTIQYGATTANYDSSSVKVYLAGTPVQTGNISLTNTTAKPSTISQSYALVDLTLNGQKVSTVQVPWSGQFTVNNLTPGTYTVSPESLTDSAGSTYQGTANPTSVVVTSNATVSSSVSYQKIAVPGSINIKAQALPSDLTGYTLSPTVTLTRAGTGAVVTRPVGWNATTTVSGLDNGIAYTLSTPDITFGSKKCTAAFSPATVTSKSTSPDTSSLSYTCATVAQDAVTIKINGVPSSTSTINVKFQPADGSAAISKDVTVSGGTGTGTVNLTDGSIYSVSSTTVPSYTATFSLQPLTAKPNVTETITYQAATARLMAYVPGWKTPPSATSMSAAGYTNALVAFGVFSTTQPGAIVSAFDTVTKAYIDSLHQAGIKVSLSLGGASSSVVNTTVDFHQVLSLASSTTAFQQTFVQSVQNLVTQYGFDGVDFDIEQGLNGGGTFTNPVGDIAVLANIINTLHQNNPGLLISLAPQVANVSPTRGYDATWGNYAALVMQTHDALSWVGVQIYNTGCAYGLDLVCYADDANSPNLSVAMAAGLLENWPSTTSSGQATGFQPYISYLKPSQVVLGYPAPNKSGVSDGAPAKPTSVIKRAIQCLRTATAGSNSCASYVPPHAYPGIGGVFEWEITYDQDNSFKFATDLKACLLSGTC